MLLENSLKKYKETPESIKKMVGLVSLTATIIFTFIMLNIFFGEIKDSKNLADLVKELNIQAPNFAMALNQQVVPRSQFDSTRIKENDKVEIVHAVGGGV